MKNITLFDTSIASDNLGDKIIMEAVISHLREIYPEEAFTCVPTHVPLSGKNRQDILNNGIGFVGGTNLLCSNWFFRPQWKIGILDAWKLPHPVLMGVGWKFYQRPTDFITAIFLRKLLSAKYVHSVRDSYTEKRLRAIGVNNVINTACPTMWNLKDGHCPLIPKRKAAHALVTLTAYRHDPELDKRWLEKVIGGYEKIYFWPQMKEDGQYVKDMGLAKNIEILQPTLKAYDDALSTLDVDFVGTRLHGGIRALQHKRRTIIIEVDNRAVEIARDTGLPTIKRDDAEGLARWIESDAVMNLSLPRDNIEKWKGQFRTFRQEEMGSTQEALGTRHYL